MTTQPHIWVVCRNNGYEGLDAPMAAFLSEDSAMDYAVHMDKIPIMVKLFKVALYPALGLTEEVHL